MKKCFFAVVEIPANDNEAFGISFPDFPGCFSAADKAIDIHKNAKEALESHIELLDDVENILASTILTIGSNYNYADYCNKMVIIIEVDI